MVVVVAIIEAVAEVTDAQKYQHHKLVTKTTKKITDKIVLRNE